MSCHVMPQHTGPELRICVSGVPRTIPRASVMRCQSGFRVSRLNSCRIQHLCPQPPRGSTSSSPVCVKGRGLLGAPTGGGGVKDESRTASGVASSSPSHCRLCGSETVDVSSCDFKTMNSKVTEGDGGAAEAPSVYSAGAGPVLAEASAPTAGCPPPSAIRRRCISGQ